MPSSSSRSLDSRALALLVIADLSLVAGCNASFSFDPAAGSVGGGGATGSALSAGAGAPNAFGTCTHDQDCGLPSLHCNVSSMRCVECTSDSQCPAARPACSAATGVCSACSVTVDCAAGQQCDLQTNKCLVLCAVDADCNDVRSSCNRSGTCQVCDDEDDCSGAHCQRSAGACVQCLDESHCHGVTPHCAQALGLCVACKDSADCARGAPFCDPTVHVCSAAIAE